MKSLFSAWHDWRERRDILCELRRQQANDREQFRFKVRDELEEALSALLLDDRLKATQIWTNVVARYPKETRASPLALQLLLKLGRFDEADALMRQGQKHYPGHAHFTLGLAAIAEQKGDHSEAIERYAAARKRFPGVAQAYVAGVRMLAAKQRLDEAEALAVRTMKRFPSDIGGFIEHARIAVRRQDWTGALRRWQVIRDRFDGYSIGHVGCAQAMTRFKRFDEADEILSAAQIRFPGESSPATEAAHCAEARGDVSEAVRRWKRRTLCFPFELSGYSDAAAALERLNHADEAEATLRAAIDRFPTEQRPRRELEDLLRRHEKLRAAARAQTELRQTLQHSVDPLVGSGGALQDDSRSTQQAEPNRSAR
jgi:tetratricopeptide (TPR) repeat protein